MAIKAASSMKVRPASSRVAMPSAQRCVRVCVAPKDAAAAAGLVAATFVTALALETAPAQALEPAAFNQAAVQPESQTGIPFKSNPTEATPYGFGDNSRLPEETRGAAGAPKNDGAAGNNSARNTANNSGNGEDAAYVADKGAGGGLKGIFGFGGEAKNSAKDAVQNVKNSAQNATSSVGFGPNNSAKSDKATITDAADFANDISRGSQKVLFEPGNNATQKGVKDAANRSGAQ